MEAGKYSVGNNKGMSMSERQPHHAAGGSAPLQGEMEEISVAFYQHQELGTGGYLRYVRTYAMP